jgi:hypothetical protein
MERPGQGRESKPGVVAGAPSEAPRSDSCSGKGYITASCAALACVGRSRGPIMLRLNQAIALTTTAIRCRAVFSSAWRIK